MFWSGQVEENADGTKGPVEAGKLSVVAGDLSYVDLAARPRDMQYGSLSSNARMEILGAFGIGGRSWRTPLARGGSADGSLRETLRV